tara:strand:+ start:421 stop:846 length:426 start_codon:yes stop_codon:yes gene_type:complete
LNLEIIQEMWEKDSKIDEVMLDEASLRIPALHSKYLNLHNEFSLLKKKKEQDLRTTQHRKWLYYSGKAPEEDYVEQPFNHKVIKSDVIHWVQVDEMILKLEMKIEYYDTILNTLNEILKQVNQLSYNIRNAIQWRAFVGGT